MVRSFDSLMESYERLLARPNPADEHFYNGLFTRYRNPVLTREHIPPFWMYDADPESNPFMMQRLGVNAVLNSGAIRLNGKYCLVVRVEGADRKSFFAVAESDRPTEGFRFRDYPVILPDTEKQETNVYDMRLTQHEDGWIYGVFCSESKDPENPDLSAAVAAAGIVRTKDLDTWERLPNLVTLNSPQQRNVVLHPEFVDGKYAFYTRPMDDFIETGSGGGIGFGLCEDGDRRGKDHFPPEVSHDYGGQERRGGRADQNRPGLDSPGPRRSEHGGRAAVRAVCLCHGPGGSVETDRRALRHAAGTFGTGTDGRREQRGFHQRRHRG